MPKTMFWRRRVDLKRPNVFSAVFRALRVGMFAYLEKLFRGIHGSKQKMLSSYE